ncbi:MAG: c-type cytochrome biogenesis protein CcmI [Gammaproteobacteria bacterium]|nr:c-type cytochrome biogenesis protein CcmI [Gammaproteobacteria bacterium]
MIWFFSGALALSAVTVALLLPALLGRRRPRGDGRDMQNIEIARRRLEELEPDDDAARAEIELALLDDLEGAEQPERPAKTPGMFSTALLLALIPLSAALLYLALGSPAALAPRDLTASPPAQMPPIGEMIAQLERKLEASPEDANGWQLAARTYMHLGRFADAARAYRTLHQLRGDDADILAAWADAEVMANNGAFTEDARANIERALALRPAHKTALWLAALAAESQSQPARALGYLRRLQPLLAEDARAGAEVEKFIARMRELGGE